MKFNNRYAMPVYSFATATLIFAIVASIKAHIVHIELDKEIRSTNSTLQESVDKLRKKSAGQQNDLLALTAHNGTCSELLYQCVGAMNECHDTIQRFVDEKHDKKK